MTQNRSLSATSARRLPVRRMAPPTPGDRGGWPALVAVVFAVFMTTLDNTVVNVALPSIQEDLHLGLSGLAWVVNAYVLSFAVLLLTGGRLADVFGRRQAFLTGLAGFTGASLLAGLAPGPAVLIAARVLQGAAAALMTPPTLRSSATPSRSRGSAEPLSGCGVARPPLRRRWARSSAAFSRRRSHWSWIFYVNVPVGLLGLVVGARYIPESRDTIASRRLDLAGLVLSTGALFALTYGLIEANAARMDVADDHRAAERGGSRTLRLRLGRAARSGSAGRPRAVPQRDVHGCQPRPADRDRRNLRCLPVHVAVLPARARLLALAGRHCAAAHGSARSWSPPRSRESSWSDSKRTV